jgi:undecaprenyl-phosphate 4-deoxy-4-formamido-L-arabinose transferase
VEQPPDQAPTRHRISVVIPVYAGESTLFGVVDEVLALPTDWTSPDGHLLSVTEVLLVWDRGPDRSDRVIRDLAARDQRVRPIWLTRNFGQHAATLAGMASSGGDWVVTIDEDAQHDITAIPRMLDRAMAERAAVVYAAPTGPTSHGTVRNLSSRLAKLSVGSLTGTNEATRYQSFRLVIGEIARSVAAYAGSGVYLDVALGWVTHDVTTCPVEPRRTEGRRSGYTFRSLLSHYWRLVISSGTGALRIVSVTGVILALLGFLGAILLVVTVALGVGVEVRGWASTIVIMLLTSGATLFSLGIIAEYLGAAVNMAMGKPLYLIGSDPESGPLGPDDA